MEHVVVTGVATGIGLACAKDLIGSGRHVFGSVRKQADAERLGRELGDGFTPLIFDVTDEAAIGRAAEEVKARLAGAPLAGLVNNAGVAVSGPLMHIPLDEVRQQIEINVIGLLAVTQRFLPLLGAQKGFAGQPGRVVNISSVSGHRALPFVGPYSISKFGVEALTDSLRREMFLYGVDVISVAPGPVKTPIWDKAERTDISQYEGTDYFKALQRLQKRMLELGRKGLPPEKIAATVREALFSASPRAHYTLVPSYFSDVLIPSLLPARMFDRLIAKALGLKKV